jgi:2-polyprenyl-6-methoxyphenol hydroxylase-like FAD-dependent oxidoreductase
MQETPQRMMDSQASDENSLSGRVFLLGDAAGGIYPALGQ